MLIAASAEEALDRAAVAGPHLAIVDLLLPDQHGIELCRRLREWSEMPILVLSAIGDEQTKIDALHHGADDYVTKPFGPGRAGRPRPGGAAPRRARARASRASRSGAWSSISPRTPCGSNGAEVHLTPTEFSLLRVLVLNRGLLMTHRQLLSEVWGPGVRGRDAGAANAHREPARQAAGAVSRTPRLIRTDSGIGYRFSALTAVQHARRSPRSL